mmetsp:Transcript_7728/g.14034  ORF Transcript_7728/g.14034 Transcript_7728/m.14034 type:complete len:236 (+) Transcript_7728:1145-1852(+)
MILTIALMFSAEHICALHSSRAARFRNHPSDCRSTAADKEVSFSIRLVHINSISLSIISLQISSLRANARKDPHASLQTSSSLKCVASPSTISVTADGQPARRLGRAFPSVSILARWKHSGASLLKSSVARRLRMRAQSCTNMLGDLLYAWNIDSISLNPESVPIETLFFSEHRALARRQRINSTTDSAELASHSYTRLRASIRVAIAVISDSMINRFDGFFVHKLVRIFADRTI